MMFKFKKYIKSKNISRTERSGIINMALKPISFILSILYTPILLSYLGDESYGLWATLLSIINWVNYFDVGIGHGFRNLLSSELGENKLEEAKKSVSTAYIILSIIATILLLVIIIISCFIDWNKVFSTKINIRVPLMISFAFICINFVLALANNLLYALQLSERVALRSCLVQTMNIILLLILSKVSHGSLLLVSIMFGSTTMIVHLYNTISVMKKYTYLIPSFASFAKEKIKTICNIGLKFFIIQIMCVLVFTVDNIIITHYFGAIYATPFSIAHKVYNTIYSIFAAFMMPYWSRSTVAYSKGDVVWFKSSIKKTALICTLFCFGYLLFIPFFKPLVSIWLHKELEFQNGLIIVMAIYFIFYSILTLECQFINGTGQLNVQLIMYCFIGIINIPLSIFLGVYCGLSSVGVRLATTILVAAASLVLGINLYNIIKKSNQSS